MARPRRLRYKLMLGLGLVVGSIGLLIAGTLYGIRAYNATVRTTDRKMAELIHVTYLVDTLKVRHQTQANPDLEAGDFQTTLDTAREWLKQFSDVNRETVSLGVDPDDGETEAALVKQLKDKLDQIEWAMKNPVATGTAAQTTAVSSRPEVQAPYEEARQIAETLRWTLLEDVQVGIRKSNQTISRARWVVWIATFWAVVLTLTMLYYFRVWMFAPIRQLQAGVHRVHGGDFGQPIALSSGDELQELADEFNAMTARMAAIYADLARQVNERSRQLVRSERMVSVGFLAAGVAHEINNPLASILFCSEALERRLQDVLSAMTVTLGSAAASDSEVLTRYLKMIQQEALRCKDITQKLLDFSRSGEKKREPTDLAGLVRGVLEVARHLPNCRGKNITFEPSAYIVAPVNGQDLKSVILNLIVNALDSMEEGGRLAISMEMNAGLAELVFADTGCGMTPDVLQNIFEPFFTRSRTGKGTGLGLFISHQIIDQHGGAIEAASPGPGFGSTFTVRVPLTATATGGNEGGSPEPTVLTFPGSRAAA